MSTYGNIEEITKMVLQAIDSTKANKPEFKVPVGISARHIHLTQEHVEQLFGKGYQLTKKKELMGGQFASNEQCTIVGLKLRAIENVRILGPVRSSSQVEISATDARTLGINAIGALPFVSPDCLVGALIPNVRASVAEIST